MTSISRYSFVSNLFDSCHSWYSVSFHGIFTGLRERKLKLKRERPFGVVRDGIGFYEALRRLRIDSKERRVREIPEVIDDDFLLFRIPEVQAAHVNAVDCSGSRGFSLPGPRLGVGGGVDAVSAARFSETPNSFPPEVAASSVIHMSDSGRREFSCSRICGQKLRSFTAVISGVAVLSNAVICFLSLSNCPSATRMVSFFWRIVSAVCCATCAARV